MVFRSDEQRHGRALLLLTIGAALLLGVAVRIPPLAAVDFPLNDGGIFIAMASDLQANSFLLPEMASYNGGDIPYAYPPLGIYVTAALDSFVGVDPMFSARWLPFLVNLVTIVAVFFVSREILGNGSSALLAGVLFPLLPHSYRWAIMGGSLTRSFGFLFMALAALSVHRSLRRGGFRDSCLAGLAISGAVLSHPEEGLLALTLPAVFWLVSDRTRVGLGRSLVSWVAAGLLTAPWWATVLVKHGLAPFLAATQTSNWSTSCLAALATFMTSAESGLAILTMLAVVGFLAEAARGRFVLLAWLVTAFVVVPRSAFFPASVPLALAAAVALGDVILPKLRQIATTREQGDQPEGLRRVRQNLHLAVPAALVALVIGYALAGNWKAFVSGEDNLVAPTEEERVAAEWMKSNTSPSAVCLVMTQRESWSTDTLCEWFPLLSERVSPTTCQGSEWIPGGEFNRRWNAHMALKIAMLRDASYLNAVVQHHQLNFSHVVISKTPNGPYRGDALLQSLRYSPQYRLVFENGGAAVFERIG